MIEERMKIDKKKFGKFIASRRRALPEGLTQEALAKSLHVGTSAIGKIEAGETLPSFELFIDLADALLMTPGELMMVMAEREDGNRNYMEMSDWLISRLENLVDDYHKITESTGTDKPRRPYTPDKQARDIVSKTDQQIKDANPNPYPMDIPENSESN